MQHFKVLYQTYYKKVYTSCLLVLKDQHLAEEVTQDAFIKAYQNISQLKDANKFGSWVAAIGVRKAINIINRNKKVIPLDDNNLMANLEIRDHRFAQNQPLEFCENQELKNEITKAIKSLKPPLNQIVILKYYWELKDREIAEHLDLPEGTVKSSLYRAKRLLMNLLSINNNQEVGEGSNE